jgi:hypothetical protein
MMVSLMLILSMFAFAAESAPSATVGYVKYSCLYSTTLTDLNFVALPVGSGYTMVGQFDLTGTNIGTISKYNAATQLWTSTSYNAMLGWVGNYAAVDGQAYMVTAKKAFDFIVDGPVVTMPTYNLVYSTTLTDLNAIMHPMTKAALTTAGAIGTDIGTANCGTVAKHNATTQLWQSTSYNAMLGWVGNYASEIATPLMVTMKANVAAWPYSKENGDDVIVDNGEETVAPKGAIMKDFYWEVFQADGTTHYNFAAAPYDGVTAKAWIAPRLTELLTTTAGSIAWIDFGGTSIVQLNTGNFPTTYATGNVLNIVVKDEDPNPDIEGYNIPFVLDAADDAAVFSGPAFGMGLGISVNTPSSIENEMVPVETRLHQNYPNPFNPTTTIKFDLASNSNVKLNVYNYNGQLVKSLVNGTMNAGFHSVNFDASSLSAGVYYYTMEAAGKSLTQKMVLVK